MNPREIAKQNSLTAKLLREQAISQRLQPSSQLWRYSGNDAVYGGSVLTSNFGGQTIACNGYLTNGGFKPEQIVRVSGLQDARSAKVDGLHRETKQTKPPIIKPKQTGKLAFLYWIEDPEYRGLWVGGDFKPYRLPLTSSVLKLTWELTTHTGNWSDYDKSINRIPEEKIISSTSTTVTNSNTLPVLVENLNDQGSEGNRNFLAKRFLGKTSFFSHSYLLVVLWIEGLIKVPADSFIAIFFRASKQNTNIAIAFNPKEMTYEVRPKIPLDRVYTRENAFAIGLLPPGLLELSVELQGLRGGTINCNFHWEFYCVYANGGETLRLMESYTNEVNDPPTYKFCVYEILPQNLKLVRSFTYPNSLSEIANDAKSGLAGFFNKTLPSTEDILLTKVGYPLLRSTVVGEDAYTVIYDFFYEAYMNAYYNPIAYNPNAIDVAKPQVVQVIRYPVANFLTDVVTAGSVQIKPLIGPTRNLPQIVYLSIAYKPQS